MKAKIIDKNGCEYLSPVFGMAKTEDVSWLVLNNEKTALVFAPTYEKENLFLKRKVFVFGVEEDWIAKVRCGNTSADLYVAPFLAPFIDNVFDSAPIPEKVKDKVLRIADETIETEWNEVKDQKSADELLMFSGGFHDGTVERINYRAESESQGELSVEISGCRGVDIELLFSGRPHFHFCGCNRYYFFDSSIFFAEDRVILVDEELQSPDEISDDDVWFSAEALKWRYKLNG